MRLEHATRCDGLSVRQHTKGSLELAPVGRSETSQICLAAHLETPGSNKAANMSYELVPVGRTA